MTKKLKLIPTSFRLDGETYRLLTALASKLGVVRVRVIGLAIRKLAEREKVE